MKTTSSCHLSDYLWDLWCILSIVGIWPRFIEPNLIETNTLALPIDALPSPLQGLRIVQFSDLHLNRSLSDKFLSKLIKKIKECQPDIVVCTGDFLCYAQTDCLERLKLFLKQIQAPYGCYAILGNHDYEEAACINSEGEYDILSTQSSMIGKGLSRLFTETKLAKRTTKRARELPPNKKLLEALADTPFSLLHNQNRLIPIKGSFLNLCGLGEYSLARALPTEAFENYDENYPGIILAHNPDAIPLLADFPGQLILCGHTHGGQVYLPWMWTKFTVLEHMEYVRGQKQYGDKTIYINRGIAGVMKFRWCARPEILLTILEKAS